MYRGYNLDLEPESFKPWYDDGEELFENYKTEIATVLQNFYTSTGKIDASKMQENWFPQIDADIFISHSHVDNKEAIALAGWLKDEFNLNAFVDSCLWGHSDDLLRIIDDQHCLSDTGTATYNYQKRNRSTSHVHMMLATSLTKMMDNTECIFFLNTPASINSQKYIKSSTTTSPWIYSEIAMTKMLRKIKPKRGLAKLAKAMNENNRGLVQYDLELEHLTDFTIDHLMSWKAAKTPSKHHLDTLYSLI